MSISVSGSQITFNDASTQNTAATGFGFKNRIINGAMSIWQRGTSVSGTYAYGADRWATLPFATATISQSSDVPTAVSQFSLKLQRSAGSSATTPIGVQQTIESKNCYDLSGQTITISFWAKAGANFSSSANSLGVQFITGTAADQGGSSYTTWTGQATIINATATLTTSWQRFTYTGTVGANVLEATAIFFFTPTGTAGADDSFLITGVQLEKGSTATSFDYRPYGTELLLCQRYYQVVANIWANSSCGFVGTINVNDVATRINFNPQMRTTPTITTFSENGTSGRISANRNAAGYASTQLGADFNGVTLLNGSGSNLTGVSNITFSWNATAEL